MRRSAPFALLLPILAGLAGPATAQTAVSADGVVESTTGGFRFPDASVQKTAGVTVTNASRTIAIPGDFATLADAFAALQRERIAPGAKITLQLADGTYSSTEPLRLWHSEGRSIEILGNLAAPDNVVLSFDGSAGLEFDGASLGLLDGVTVQGNQSGSPYDKVGVLAGAGSLVKLGSAVVVDGFDLGIVATLGGVVTADSTTASNNTLHGFAATSGGILHANLATSSGNGGNGFEASTDGTLVADGATANGNAGDGFAASFSSRIHADAATAEDNSGSGFAATFGSYLSVRDGAALNNGPFGYFALQNSYVDVTGAVSSGHTVVETNLERTLVDDASVVHDDDASPPP